MRCIRWRDLLLFPTEKKAFPLPALLENFSCVTLWESLLAVSALLTIYLWPRPIRVRMIQSSTTMATYWVCRLRTAFISTTTSSSPSDITSTKDSTEWSALRFYLRGTRSVTVTSSWSFSAMCCSLTHIFNFSLANKELLIDTEEPKDASKMCKTEQKRLKKCKRPSGSTNTKFDFFTLSEKPTGGCDMIGCCRRRPSDN